jgi:hypothetical protein
MIRFLPLALVLVLSLSGGAVLAKAPDPLRFYPEAQTQVVVKIERPRELIEGIVRHPLAGKARELPIVREALDSPQIRKFLQLIAYYETDLGHPWPELVDKLAGGGITLGMNYNFSGKTQAIFVLQGTDEAVTKKFWSLALKVIEEEASREGGAPAKMETRQYEGCDCAKIGDDFFFARVVDALVLANTKESLKAAIDQHVANGKGPNLKTMANSPRMRAETKILPANPIAWFWMDLKPVKELPQAKDLFVSPRNDIVQTLLFAGQLDVARRSDFVSAGLFHDKGNFHFRLRAPAGRDGMARDVELHLPKDPKVGGSLPLLEPKGVLFCHSFYMDFETLYKDRDAILPPQSAKDFAEGEKQLSRFLIGTTLPKLLAASGVHHRVVAAQPEVVPEYKTEPQQRLPSVAFVTSMRDPAFAKSATAIIKGAAFALNQQATLKLWEGELAGVKVFGYSFPENGKFPDDPTKARFNYQPTFAVVKDQYIFATNKKLCKELIEIIQKEDQKPQSPNLQTRGYALGLGDYAISQGRDTLAGTILAQAIPLGEAKGQVEKLFQFLQQLGTLNVQTDYAAKEFRFDIEWKNR